MSKQMKAVDLSAVVASMALTVKWQPLSFESRPQFDTRVLFCIAGHVYIGQLLGISQRYASGVSSVEVCNIFFDVVDDGGESATQPDFWAPLVPPPEVGS